MFRPDRGADLRIAATVVAHGMSARPKGWRGMDLMFVVVRRGRPVAAITAELLVGIELADGAGASRLKPLSARCWTRFPSRSMTSGPPRRTPPCSPTPTAAAARVAPTT